MVVADSLDAFVNLPTLNYLLAGIQLCYIPTNKDKSKWFDLLYDLDKERFHSNDVKLTFMDIRHIVRELIRPFGVVRGSERQGGQDEGRWQPPQPRHPGRVHTCKYLATTVLLRSLQGLTGNNHPSGPS